MSRPGLIEWPWIRLAIGFRPKWQSHAASADQSSLPGVGIGVYYLPTLDSGHDRVEMAAVETTTYFTNIGPARGPILNRDFSLLGAIGVLAARGNHSPIGMALPTGWDEEGRILWRLTQRKGKVELPGLWVVVDREFRPAQSNAP